MISITIIIAAISIALFLSDQGESTALYFTVNVLIITLTVAKADT